MTLGEVERAIESKKRVHLAELKERATMDYILGDLIGRSVARIHSSSARYPDIEATYPTLFNSEEIQEAKQQKRDEMSIIRFRQFTQSFNKKFEEVGEK